MTGPTLVTRDTRAFVRSGPLMQAMTPTLEQLLLQTLERPDQAVKLPLMGENKRSNLRSAWVKYHPESKLTIRKTIDGEFVAWVEAKEEEE